MRFSKRKENESTENVALFNKTHKVNKKLCFYYKKTQTLCEDLFEEEK
jgi:hypothetical protein